MCAYAVWLTPFPAWKLKKCHRSYIDKVANILCSFTEEPPLIQIPPEVGQKAAESQTITLKCTVFGSPKPTIIWYKANEQLTGGRYKVLDHGDLQITVGRRQRLIQDQISTSPSTRAVDAQRGLLRHVVTAPT